VDPGHHGGVHKAAADAEHDAGHAEETHERRLSHCIGLVPRRLSACVAPCERDDIQANEEIARVAPSIGTRAEDAGIHGLCKGAPGFSGVPHPKQLDIGVVVEIE